MKLYTDTSLVPEGKKPVFLLWPLLGIAETDPQDPDHGRFAGYLACGKSMHTLCSNPAEADVFVLPSEFLAEQASAEKTRRFAELAVTQGKKLIVFFNSDFSDPIPFENAEIFRTTSLRSKRSRTEHGFPGWSNDFAKYSAGKIKSLKKPEKPRIGYCGYVDYENFSQRIRYGLAKGSKEEMYRAGPEIRGAAVRSLRKENRIETDFLIRNGFWAAGIADKNAARSEYAQNMMASPYALVARGAGNFSYRLYEVLSCGRIPVFIDTDCILPFDEFLDWKKYLLWIDYADRNRIAEKLLDFHAALSPGDFEEMQLNARRLYEEWIRPEAFFGKIETYFIPKP